MRTALIVLLSDVKESYGFENSSLKYVYKYLIPYNYQAHDVQRNLDLIGFKYDEKSWKIKPELKVNEKIKENIESFIKVNNLDTNIIAIAPGSIWYTKRYPLEYFKKIISELIKKKYKIILIGGEKDKSICEQLLPGIEDVITTAGRFSLLESIELIKKAKLLISNDSAPTHMGMCANIPVLTLYCSTTFNFGFFPYNEKSSYLSYDDLFCKPCGIHGYDECPLGTFDCGKLLKPETVISKIEDMMDDKN
jgi:heptosyltransferase-2